MATNYINASEAADETLMFLMDVCSAEYLLNELFNSMSVDEQVVFVRDFIRFHDVDTSELNDETLRTVEEHYKRHC